MTIQTARHIDDFEDSARTYYVCMDKSNGKVYGINGIPNCTVAAEALLDDLLYTGTPEAKPADLPNRDLVVVEVDAELGEALIENRIDKIEGTNKAKDMREVLKDCKCRSEYKKSTAPRSLNDKHKTGIPPGHLKKTMIAKFQGKKALNGKGPELIIQNFYKSRARRIDAEIPKEDMVERILTEDADRIEISVAGEFDQELDGRFVFVVRYDGKVVGKYKIRGNALSFSATFFDHARGDHLYQLQLESPLEGDAMRNPSIVIEEDDPIVKFKKKEPEPEVL